MDQRGTATTPTNGASAPHELFALTDEQILEIAPEVAPAATPPSHEQPSLVIPSEARDRGNTFEHTKSQSASHDSSSPPAPRNDSTDQSVPGAATSHDSPEAPAWLAAQMKDPWNGEEARQLWNAVVQAREETAAYRAVFATPEDAIALKQLYPGGVNEARAVANRAQLLEQIDQAYFGAAGKSAEETTAARAQLAHALLREDPAAFREMVFAGLRALEGAEEGSTGNANTGSLPRLGQLASRIAADGTLLVAPPFRATSAATETQSQFTDVGLKPAATQTFSASTVTSRESQLAAYAVFEKAANEDLEQSVSAAITRTLQQALPNLKGGNAGAAAGARSLVPLKDRLTAAVRQDVEAALKDDRALGEQVAQILAAHRFDNETRAQVVRLIHDRARQLVPGAAKRVINDWTQTALAAHRSNVTRSDATSSKREVEPVSPPVGSAALASPGKGRLEASATRPRVDYRKLTDEQILAL